MTRYLTSITDGHQNWGHEFFDTETPSEAAKLCKEADAKQPKAAFRPLSIVVTPANIGIHEMHHYDYKTLNILTEADFEA